jgi:hypothetical protein
MQSTGQSTSREELISYTKTAARFAECLLYSAKATLHSSKPLPSATLGKEAPSKPFTVNPALPSAKSRAFDKGFAECRAVTRQRFDAVGRQVTPFCFFIYIFPLPSATLGKEFLFFLKKTLCRVS